MYCSETALGDIKTEPNAGFSLKSVMDVLFGHTPDEREEEGEEMPSEGTLWESGGSIQSGIVGEEDDDYSYERVPG